jgi:hypothetical protein
MGLISFFDLGHASGDRPDGATLDLDLLSQDVQFGLYRLQLVKCVERRSH